MADSETSARFERAADAMVAGDANTLGALLAEDPGLARARSERAHGATLLHYASANEVEDERQRTPANIVALATLVLDAGAQVDAVTRDGSTTLYLTVSSVHPARAGVQVALAELLLDRGAAIEGPANDGSPLLTAVMFGYADAAEALARRGARVDHVISAAALDRLDVLASMFSIDGIIWSGREVTGLDLPIDAKRCAEYALLAASTHGRADAVGFLLEHGVDLAARDNQGFTALHWASFKGRLEVIDRLLENNAPLELRNDYGGTVLDTTVWAAANAKEPIDYQPIVERLLAAGADATQVDPFPTGIASLDALLQPHR